MLLIRGQQTHLSFYSGKERGRVGKNLRTDAQMAKRSVRWIYADSLRRVKSGGKTVSTETDAVFAVAHAPQGPDLSCLGHPPSPTFLAVLLKY